MSSHATGLAASAKFFYSDPLLSVKPRPHQQQCRSNIVECYKLIDSFDKVETS